MTRDEFYADDPTGRWLSPEADYGVHWRNGPGPGPTWRVSYVRNTGEVYAVQLNGFAQVIILGVVPANHTDDDLMDSERPADLWYADLEDILDGYAEEPHRDISWVRDRLAAYQPA